MSRSEKEAHRNTQKNYVSMRSYAHEYACVCSLCVFVCVPTSTGQWWGWGFLITHSLNILSVRQSLSLNLQVTDFADQFAKNPLGTILSPCLQLWDYSCVLPYHDQHSSGAVGNHTRVPMPAGMHFYQPSHLSILPKKCFLFPKFICQAM